MQTRHLNALLIVAILLISTVPLYAQRQQQNVVKLKADAQKVVSIISGDEAKKQTYCEARGIAKQIVQAGQQKDNEKAEELADKLTEQQMNLGSEYLALMQSLRNANLTPKDGREIESLFDELDESCPRILLIAAKARRNSRRARQVAPTGNYYRHPYP